MCIYIYIYIYISSMCVYIQVLLALLLLVVLSFTETLTTHCFKPCAEIGSESLDSLSKCGYSCSGYSLLVCGKAELWLSPPLRCSNSILRRTSSDIPVHFRCNSGEILGEHVNETGNPQHNITQPSHMLVPGRIQHRRRRRRTLARRAV